MRMIFTSHPLAWRVLSQIYGATLSSSSRRRCVAVVGHSAHVPSDSGEFRLATEPIKAKDVYDYLISLPYISDYVE